MLGYGALVSFGHAAFLGIGAYAVGILSSHGFGDAVVRCPRRSPPRRCSRSSPARSRCARKGVYFIMITLAFGQMLFFLATSLAAYGGDDGMTLADAQPRRSARALLEERRLRFYYVSSPASSATYLPLPRDRRLALRPRAARHARELVRMQAIGFSPFRLPARRLRDRGMMAGLPASCSPTRPSSSAPPT